MVRVIIDRQMIETVLTPFPTLNVTNLKSEHVEEGYHPSWSGEEIRIISWKSKAWHHFVERGFTELISHQFATLGLPELRGKFCGRLDSEPQWS